MLSFRTRTLGWEREGHARHRGRISHTPRDGAGHPPLGVVEGVRHFPDHSGVGRAGGLVSTLKVNCGVPQVWKRRGNATSKQPHATNSLPESRVSPNLLETPPPAPPKSLGDNAGTHLEPISHRLLSKSSRALGRNRWALAAAWPLEGLRMKRG